MRKVLTLVFDFTHIYLNIVRTTLFLKGVGVNFNYFKYGAGAGLLKRGAGTFPIKLFNSLSFLHLEITLQSYHQLQDVFL